MCLLPGCQVLGIARPTVSRLLLLTEFCESLIKSFFYFLLQLLIIVIYYRRSTPCTLFSFPAQCLVLNLVELRETNSEKEFPHLSLLACQTTGACRHGSSLSSGTGRVAFSCPSPMLLFLPLSDSIFLSLFCSVFITLPVLSSFSMSPIFLPFA